MALFFLQQIIYPNLHNLMDLKSLKSNFRDTINNAKGLWQVKTNRYWTGKTVTVSASQQPRNINNQKVYKILYVNIKVLISRTYFYSLLFSSQWSFHVSASILITLSITLTHVQVCILVEWSFTIWTTTSQPSCKVVTTLKGYEHLAQNSRT